uniref:DUF4153 domain-containing protein n=2 Tax=Flavobacterium sp. TaxID=239 RepID=UPI00404A92B8
MKKHHLILGSSLVFLFLFYKESMGLNLAVYGLTLLGLICYNNVSQLKNWSIRILVLTSFLSCLAYAWYSDFVSFLALFFSLFFLQFKINDSELKVLNAIPVSIINIFASIIRIFNFSQWLPKRKIGNNALKILLAYVLIPAVFLSLFFLVYSFGSDHFSYLFTGYTLNVDFLPLIFTVLLGLYVSFSFWNYFVPKVCVDFNPRLDNEFKPDEIKLSNSFSFLDIDFERKSGEITFLLLNVLLLVFIATYNYEQFFEEVSLRNLSSDTHARVNSVIFSIIMAVGVILFYFKSGFNFDFKSQTLKRLAMVWLFLNGLLILSAVMKNSEYIFYQGLTYKRLGVYAFLGLTIAGLYFSFIKISKQKTNAFLFNKMLWYFYGLILLCSFFNWGNFITNYNVAVEIGDNKNYLRTLEFNDAKYFELFPEELEEHENFSTYKKRNVLKYKRDSFLSKTLYYETIDLE